MRADKTLLDLTNEFLEKFFIESHRLQNESATQEKYKQPLAETKSYSFGYKLVDCLMESDYITKEKYFADDMMPLIDMGFVDNLAKQAFNFKIKGSVEKLEFVINNLDKQPEYEDIRATEPVVVTETYIDKMSMNPKFVFKKDGSGLGENDEPFFIEKEKTMVTKTFTISNNRSGRVNTISVVYKEGKFDQYFLKEKDEHFPILTVNLRLDHDANDYKKTELTEDDIQYIEEGTFSHYKYIAEINSFYSNLDQVLYTIKEAFEEN